MKKENKERRKNIQFKNNNNLRMENKRHT